MFYILISIIAWASPDTGWLAFQRDLKQGFYPDEQLIVEALAESCASGSALACGWQKQRQKNDPQQNLSFFNQYCQKNNAMACTIQGWLLSQKPTAPGNLADQPSPESLQVFNKGCDLGEQRSCLELINIAMHKSPAAKHLKKTKELCEQGTLAACTLYGRFLFEGKGSLPQPKAASKIFEETCKKGNLSACGYAAISEAMNEPTVEIGKKLQKSCVDGFRQSCLWLGLMYVQSKPQIALPYFELGCKGLDGDSCTEQAKFYLHGKVVSPDLQQAKSLLSTACQADGAQGCYLLGKLKESDAIQSQLPEIREHYNKACLNNYPPGCFASGYWKESGKGGPANPSAGLKDYQKGCKGDYGPACINGGLLLQKTKSNQHKQAVKLFRHGCSLGDKLGCSQFASMLLEGQGTKKDIPKAIDLLEISCLAGDKTGCKILQEKGLEQLAESCQSGNGQHCYKASKISQEPVSSFEFIKKGCDSQHGLSCVRKGFFYIKGYGVKQDFQLAKKHFDESCQNDIGEGCFGSGLMYLEGKGIEQSKEMAIDRMKLACDLGDTRGCTEAGRLLFKTGDASALEYLKNGCNKNNMESCAQYAFVLSSQSPPKMKEAAVIFEKACTKGHAKSCFNHAIILHNGTGVPKDTKRAQAVMHKACQLGDSDACKLTKKN